MKQITIDSTTVTFDSQDNKIQMLTHPKQHGGNAVHMFLDYSEAREILDCLLTEFGRMDIMIRYPEAR